MIEARNGGHLSACEDKYSKHEWQLMNILLCFVLTWQEKVITSLIFLRSFKTHCNDYNKSKICITEKGPKFSHRINIIESPNNWILTIIMILGGLVNFRYYVMIFNKPCSFPAFKYLLTFSWSCLGYPIHISFAMFLHNQLIHLLSVEILQDLLCLCQSLILIGPELVLKTPWGEWSNYWIWTCFCIQFLFSYSTPHSTTW